MGKKVISFSLWGDNPHYVVGALVNADIAKEQRKDWVCRFYVAPTVPKIAVDDLKSRENVEVVEMDEDISWNGMFWRFYPAEDPDVDVMISRDTDSRLDVRDAAAVDEWLASDKDLHIMRDCCQHGWHICGGLWGARNGILSNIKSMIDDFHIKDTFNKHGIDQMFLKDIVYQLFWERAFVHDDWFPNGYVNEEKHPFPIPRLRGEGWWEQEYPEWHGGIEDNQEKYPWPDGKCFLKCPACGVWHDNEYIGKVQVPWGPEKEKYSHIIDSCF